MVIRPDSGGQHILTVAADDGGNVYTSLQPNTIEQITPSGQVITYAGDGSAGHRDGPAATAEFNGIGGLAVDASGNLFVGDAWHVREIDTAGQVTTVAGDGLQCDTAGVGGPNGTAEIAPGAMAFAPSGDLYVATNGTGTGGPLMRIHFNR